MIAGADAASLSRITIRLMLAKDHSHRAWLTAHVGPRSDGKLHLHADITSAIGGAQASESERKIIATEIMGGVVLAKRHAKRGCTVELISLGAEIAGEPTITRIASIAFAVAANLAVLQGLGVEDLRSAPRGGYGWALEAIEVDGI
jgi:hypothetical protein